jgi:hypothetical protein
MANRRGARGKGWIRFSRLVTWVITILMLLVFVGSGIAMIAAGDAAQEMSNSGILSSLQNSDANAAAGVQIVAQGGTGAGIAIIVIGLFCSVSFLALMNVSLDMAENLRRITGKVLRRDYDQE